MEMKADPDLGGFFVFIRNTEFAFLPAGSYFYGY